MLILLSPIINSPLVNSFQAASGHKNAKVIILSAIGTSIIFSFLLVPSVLLVY